MEERENDQFSWTSLFFVTGISFWIFSFVLKILDASHITIFNRIGLGATILGILAFMNSWLSRKVFARDSTVRSDQ
jgi:hypothetical protein